MLLLFSFLSINIVQSMMFLFKNGVRKAAEAIYSAFGDLAGLVVVMHFSIRFIIRYFDWSGSLSFLDCPGLCVQFPWGFPDKCGATFWQTPGNTVANAAAFYPYFGSLRCKRAFHREWSPGRRGALLEMGWPLYMRHPSSCSSWAVGFVGRGRSGRSRHFPFFPVPALFLLFLLFL